VNDWFRHHQ